jgi:putative endonuclease
MRRAKQFHVYIMTNRQRSHVLYTGITGNLTRRVWEHKNKIVEGFTSRYNLTRLVYFERFFYPDAAICREKEIKGWRRSKKIELIQSMNPRWDDLAKDWGDIYKSEPAADSRKIPRPAGENAGLRDDANRLGKLADKTAPFPVEWRFDSSHALTHSNPVECPPQLECSSQRPLIRALENCAIVFFVRILNQQADS